MISGYHRIRVATVPVTPYTVVCLIFFSAATSAIFFSKPLTWEFISVNRAVFRSVKAVVIWVTSEVFISVRSFVCSGVKSKGGAADAAGAGVAVVVVVAVPPEDDVPPEEEEEELEALEEGVVEAATAPPVTTSACASTSMTAVLSPARSFGQATRLRPLEEEAGAPAWALVSVRFSLGGFQTRICFGACFGGGLGRESCLLTVIGASPPGKEGSLMLTPCWTKS